MLILLITLYDTIWTFKTITWQHIVAVYRDIQVLITLYDDDKS